MVNGMGRCRLVWLTCLGLMAVGSVLAHALAYRLVAPVHGSHAAMNHAGHAGHHQSPGVFPHIEVCLAICGSVALLALLGSLATRVRRARPLVPPLWVFGLVPPLGFIAQEQIEHLIAAGALPATALAEPTFLVGFLLQLPFALLAYGAAQLLLRVAGALIGRLGSRPSLVLGRSPTRRQPVGLVLPRLPVLALGASQRGPPVPLVS
jgi:hypothetical protein